MKHQLTDVERIMLANQFEILASTKSKYISPKEAQALSDQLTAGYSWLYEQSPYLNIEPIMCEEKAEYVVRILELFAEMQKVTQTKTNFPGFDGNNETAEYSFSQALDAAGRFSHVKGIGNNSHSETAIRYAKMLNYWRQKGGGALTQQDVNELLKMTNF